MAYAQRGTGNTPLKRPNWCKRWLEVFRDTGNVRLACHAANVKRITAYHYRDADPEFAQEWTEAEEDACDRLEAIARQRAEKVSDTLLIFLLKAHRPEKYRETVRQGHTGAGGGPIELANATRDEIQSRLARIAAVGQ